MFSIKADETIITNIEISCKMQNLLYNLVYIEEELATRFRNNLKHDILP